MNSRHDPEKRISEKIAYGTLIWASGQKKSPKNPVTKSNLCQKSVGECHFSSSSNLYFKKKKLTFKLPLVVKAL